MLEKLIQELEQLLLQEGVVANILLKSEQSVYDAGEQHEVELQFVPRDEIENPLARVHFFPIDETTCELEVEVHYLSQEGIVRETASLWESAKQIVESVSITEKRRYISTDKTAEVEHILDYFFILNLEMPEEEIHQLLSKCASEVNQLTRL
ncbi:hypothetical protein [Brevibacillus sp. SYSU BS000544]|uniref:hypothetical protein n=1 Tax=Brevibacillus sp. SYSU BS000544 TaxID=3416443 RepID=UPI003CE5043B